MFVHVAGFRYDTLATEADEVDVMLHLGDQVYTCMDGFLDRALVSGELAPNITAVIIPCRLNAGVLIRSPLDLQLWSDSYANSLTSDSVKHKMLNYSSKSVNSNRQQTRAHAFD